MYPWKDAVQLEEKVVYIGRMEDLAGIPKEQTLLPELEKSLGSPKADYYRNMSVARRKVWEGYTIKDASSFRKFSDPAPTNLRPDRTVGQTFYAAEKIMFQYRGILP
jgi:hypothetical protein